MMNLSNRLTFSFVFSVLLVSLFAFGAVPLIAQGQTVTVTGTYDDDYDDDGDLSEYDYGTMLTLTFSEPPPAVLTINDFFTSYNSQTQEFTRPLFREFIGHPEGELGFPYIEVVSGTNGMEYKLTFDYLSSHTGFYLRGYTGLIAFLGIPDTNADGEDEFYYLNARSEQIGGPFILRKVTAVVGGPTEIAAGGYIVIANHEGGYPMLPAGAVGFSSGWSNHSNDPMPNLYELFFVGGGTLSLAVTSDGSTFAGTTNSKDVVISEIMWALDEGQIGLGMEAREQWIEIHNTTDAAIRLANIRLSYSKDQPGNEANLGTEYTDRVSNIPDYVNSWNLKGQSGNSTPGALKAFKSMYRTKNDGDGWNSGHWAVSGDIYLAGFYGTPGKVNTIAGVRPARANPAATIPPKNQVIINEVFNGPGTDNDWIELRALKAQNLENWTLSRVTAQGTETEIIRFPKRTIPEGAIWLILPKQPTDSGVNLAPGHDVTIGEAANQSAGRGAHKYLVVDYKNDGFGDQADMLLILRSAKGWEGIGKPAKIHDVVGTGTFEHRTINMATPSYVGEAGKSAIWETRVWPLNGILLGDYHKDKDTLLQNDRTFVEGKAWARNGTNHGWKKDGISHVGYRGGIGYDRVVAPALAQGTPGYDNGAFKADGGDATSNVIISEVMYARKGGSQDPPQWIELYNPSSMIAVNLHNFRLTITNHAQTMDADGNMVDWEGKGIATVLLNGYSIPPKQTVLIVSGTARRARIFIPGNRIYNTFNENRSEFSQRLRSDTILNPDGFNITLHAKGHEGDRNKWQLADSVGNLAMRRAASRNERVETERFDPVRWHWPDAFTDDDERVSVARANMNTATEGYMRGIADGEMAEGWILSNMDSRTDLIDIVYYGSNTDISTPGQTYGQPLPVSLSFFRPVLENGEVVIRWTTESELDNAGFNILRSDTRNGEFKQVNSKLIQGKGTTGERSTYRWVDTTAKPGAVYYYQIEDVSFAGERQTLATTKLKGLISAKNKATTIWGELKEIQ